jgi:hypothetical protein
LLAPDNTPVTDPNKIATQDGIAYTFLLRNYIITNSPPDKVMRYALNGVPRVISLPLMCTNLDAITF